MKRLINRYKNLLAIPAIATPLLFAGGCADDLNGGSSAREDDKGVVLYVPAAPTGLTRSSMPSTRAAGDVWDLNANEAQIKSLTLVVFPSDGGAPKAIDLDDLDQATPSTAAPQGYNGYKLNLENGDYKMYVVANVAITDDDITTEEKLSDMKITVPTTAGSVAQNGLPMSCAHSDMWVDPGTGAYSSAGAGSIQISSTSGTKIKADLTFAVSKVRVTMLNDLMAATKTVNSTEINNIYSNATLFKDGTLTDSHTDGDFMADAKGYHPFDASKLTGATDLKTLPVDFTGEPADEAPASGAWAWQGVAYVGERLFTKESSDAAKVNIKFNGGDDKPLTLGKEYGTEDESKFGLRRSYFYDYVGTTTADFELLVQPWDIETISGALHGEYFLHVDKTSLDMVSAGDRTAIWYNSNANLTFNCEEFTYGDKKYPVYDITTNATNDSIYVTVHPSLPYQAYEELKAKTELWKYFTVKAGTIEKTIEVKDLSLDRYLDVDVQNVTVDVRLQISSGNYSGRFVIPVRTNLPTFTVEELTTLSGAAAGEGDNLTIGILDGETFSTYPAKVDVPESGTVNLVVNFKGLNDGDTFWSKNQTLTFNVVRGDGEETQTVNVNVLPSVDDYKIYLYAPDWTTPHIYVYQCLKLPSTHADYPNAPVGIAAGGTDTNSALEYSFTGAVAFRGWNVAYEETDGSLTNYNDPTKATQAVKTFRVFTEAPTAGNWDPGKDDWLHHYYDSDFCPSYRDGSCAGCSSTNIDRDWPGVKMKSAATELGQGWWEFTLSGVAKPGQALIMFTDADSSHNCIYGRRYPAENDPGIPLFDYPDNIGYFDVTSSVKQFTNQKPEGGTPVPTGGQLTIYVENNAGWNPLRMGYWTATSKHPYGDWGNRASMSKTTIGGTTYDTYTIDKTYNGENINELKFTNDSDSEGTNNLNVSSYTSNSNITAITLRITGANQNIQVVSTSAPSGEVIVTPPTPTDTHDDAVYYSNPENWPDVYIYYYGNGVSAPDWPGEKLTEKDAHGHYKYTGLAGKNPTHIIFNAGAGDGQPQTADISYTGNGLYTDGKR